MILIVSHGADEHVRLVTKHLSDDHVVLNTDDNGTGTSVSINERGCVFHLPGGDVTSRDVTSVWYRRVALNPGWSNSTDDPLLDQYIHQQRAAALDNAMALLGPDVKWLSEPWAVRRANLKALQLRIAREVGLSVPDYVVSDDPSTIRAMRSKGALITKMISPGTPITGDWKDQYVVFTNRLRLAEVSDAELHAAPAIYQAEIKKKCEARAVVVGEKVLTCGFETWRSPATELDWRHYDFDEVPHRRIKLPEEVCARLILYTKKLGLNFLAADLALTPNDAWIFFEGNPNGQWGWLDELAELGVAAEIAGFLENRPAGT